MNNKTIKHVVGLIAILLLVCSCAFAAQISSLECNEAKTYLSMHVEFSEDGDKGVYIAYAANRVDAPTDSTFEVDGGYYELGNIISIYQPEDFFYTLGEHGEPIDPNLLIGYNSIVLRAGDNGSDPADAMATHIALTLAEYEVFFVDEAGDVLDYQIIQDGTTPVYEGATPTKAEDENYTYEFAGWTPALGPVRENTTYTATFTAIPKASDVEYASALENVTYNNIAGTVVRITGLDTTKVVTVDGVTAKYYTKTDGTLVHVACVPQTAEPVIAVADGTPELFIFGDVVVSGTPDINDVTDMGRRVTNYERQKPTYLKYELPTDLMALLAYDVDGSGGIDINDKTALGRAVTGFERLKPTYLKYTLETMGCYSK